jgi:hypothetical protein
MANIFLSFIHEEGDAALAIHNFIEKVFDPEIGIFRSSDTATIYAGEQWMERIFHELKSAKVLISLLSPASLARPWINFEAGAAWMTNVKVIPVCLGGLTADRLPKPYSNLQAVELKSIRGAHYLASSIAHHLGLDEPRGVFLGADSHLPLACENRDEQHVLRRPYKSLLLALGFGMDTIRGETKENNTC